MEHRLIDYLRNVCKGGPPLIKRLLADAKEPEFPEFATQADLAAFLQERYKANETQAKHNARVVFRLYRGWKHYENKRATGGH